MKKQLAALGLAAALLLIPGCGVPKQQAASESILLRYAENQPKDYPTTKAAYRFADLVRERTGGRVEILVYPDAELGDEVSVVEQVQLGMIDFSRVSISTMSDINKELYVLQMPYLYQDADQMWRVLDGDLGADFLKDMEQWDITGLSWFDAGARSFYTTRPVTCLEDLKGMRIRVWESSLMGDMVRALGAQPVTMVYSDVYSGLQSGEVDGAENNWPSYEQMEHYEVAPCFVEDAHMRVPEMLMISKATMDRLSTEDQAVIRQAALESAAYERELWGQQEKESEAIARAAGVTVTTLSEEEQEKFRAATAPLYDSYCADYSALVAAIRAA